MNIVTPDPTFGLATRPTDYDSIGSGWGLGAAFGTLEHPGGSSGIVGFLEQMATDAPYGGLTGKTPFRTPGPNGQQLAIPNPSPVLQPEDANAKYGIKGALSWTAPVRESTAQLLRRWKLEQIQRDDTLSRATPGLIPGTARFLTGVAGSAMDPLNDAAAFIPVGGEARWAALAGKLGTYSTRALRGAAEGLVGTAAVEPVTYFQARQEQTNFTPADIANDLMFGTIAGSGLHLFGGMGADLVRRWQGAPVELRDAALQQGMAALKNGTPIRTDQILATAEAPERLTAAALKVGDQVYTGATHGDAFEAALKAGVPEGAISKLDMNGFQTSTGRYVSREDALAIAQGSGQKYRRVGNAVTSQGTTSPTFEDVRSRAGTAQAPQDALTFLMAKGGLRDTEGHDLANAIGQRQNPRTGPLLRKSGMSIDDAGEALHEAGYFGDPNVTPRPTEAQVLDFLREATATKRYQVGVDAGPTVDKIQARDLADNELGHAIEGQGVTVTDVERSAALDAMTESGMSASDALDHVLERSAIEGGTFTDTAQRLGDVEARLEAGRARGASLAELAPLMDERASLQADLMDQRMGDVGDAVVSDLRGGAGSITAVADAASRQADEVAQEALPVTEAVKQARAAAVNAEAQYRAVLGELHPEDRAAMDAALAHIAARRQGAIDLAGCMIREGV